jgi:hypothetical protein
MGFYPTSQTKEQNNDKTEQITRVSHPSWLCSSKATPHAKTPTGGGELERTEVDSAHGLLWDPLLWSTPLPAP